jgi:glyoxylase-like metal-dependent hydrolase (beta-lactamase superfamily II)
MIDTMAIGTPGVVAAYLVSGKEKALVDMGYASSVDSVLRDIRETIGGAGIDYLLPTHVHMDHAGACGALAQEFPAAAIRVHPKGQRHLVDPSKLWEGAGQLFGEVLIRHYARPEPIAAPRVRTIADGDEIMLGDGVVLRCLWTPGHASHHLSYSLEGRGAVLTGDAVGITYPAFPVLIPTTPPTSFDLNSAVESLERIRRLSPKRLFTPHYGVIQEAMKSVDMNIVSLRRWVAEIEEMKRGDLSLEAITANLMRQVALSGGRDSSALPLYAEISIKISVLGVIRYLSLADRKTSN